jgi:hypothetical protein
VSSAIEILGAVVLVAGALVLLALLRGIHNAAVPSRLVERALQQLPPALRARYEDEWRADLAALSETPLAATRWALGLRRASSALARQAGTRRDRSRTWPVTRAAWPQLALDAPALGLAYYFAYALRFEDGVPERYLTLFERTLPFAIIGGLTCLALVGAYAPATSRKLVKVPEGVGLVTLALVAYVAFTRPVLILGWDGFVALNVPTGVCVIFALSACALMALSRAAITLARVVRT